MPVLSILGAAYGPCDVTTEIRAMRKEQALSVKASNSVFGNSWSGETKTLVVVYLYDDEPPRVKFVKQNETLIIKPPQELTTPADYREKFRSEVRSPLAQGEMSEELNIITAVYGLEDRTDKVRNLVEHPTGVLSTQGIR